MSSRGSCLRSGARRGGWSRDSGGVCVGSVGGGGRDVPEGPEYHRLVALLLPAFTSWRFGGLLRRRSAYGGRRARGVEPTSAAPPTPSVSPGGRPDPTAHLRTARGGPGFVQCRRPWCRAFHRSAFRRGVRVPGAAPALS